MRDLLSPSRKLAVMMKDIGGSDHIRNVPKERAISNCTRPSTRKRRSTPSTSSTVGSDCKTAKIETTKVGTRKNRQRNKNTSSNLDGDKPIETSKRANNASTNRRKSTRLKSQKATTSYKESSESDSEQSTPDSEVESATHKAPRKNRRDNQEMDLGPKSKIAKKDVHTRTASRQRTAKVTERSKKGKSKQVADKDAVGVVSKKDESATKSKEIKKEFEITGNRIPEGANLLEMPSTSEMAAEMSSSDESSDDWEEVEELPHTALSPVKKEVQITVDAPGAKKKKGFDWNAYTRRLWKRFKKMQHEYSHKIELICLLQHGLMVNKVCNDPLLKALVLSMNMKINLKGKQCNTKNLISALKTIREKFTVHPDAREPESIDTTILLGELVGDIQSGVMSSYSNLVLVLVAFLRALGVPVRLCMAWHPIAFRIAHYEKQQRQAKFKETQNMAAQEINEKGKSNRSKGKSRKSTPVNEDKSTNCQIWLDIYVPSEQKWIVFDHQGSVVDLQDIEELLEKPITYIVGYDSNNKVKDITQKYDSKWMISTRKLRVDNDWWDGMLKPYLVKETKKTKAEDEQIKSQQEQMPFPATISGFKDHPLYALERHLLKFEAIYPPSAVPLGYTKTKEAIYSRSCVHTLHSRETWLKDAKQVKLGEEPYKYVKPRPRMKDKVKITEATLPVYGHWQTENYVPPVAKNGKVPRNAYGNVDFFQPQMLPVGCVHIPIPGIGKLARKMDVDCAQAMIGWEAHSGYSCPQFDGWIVCKENAAKLMAAWEEFEAEQKKKAQEKREKRIYGNWRTLIKGLFIRERLRNRYGEGTF